jgi:DNA-directed RNA polymerase III subunit RPC2
MFLVAPQVYIKFSAWGDDLPVVVALRAMGVESDQDILQLVVAATEPASGLGTGNESESFLSKEGDELLSELLSDSIDEAYLLGVHSTQRAIDFISRKMKAAKGIADYTARPGDRSAEEEVLSVLEKAVLTHVPVENRIFSKKILYIAHVVRRVLLATKDPMHIDDPEFYGNKRLDLSGSLLSMLFEDVFRRFTADLKRQFELTLSKLSRAENFDAAKCIRPDTIAQGFILPISTGNWTLKRFRMDRAGVSVQIIAAYFTDLISTTNLFKGN